jgi:hypothetical protein
MTKENGDGGLGECRVVTGEIETLLEISGFDLDGGMAMTMIQALINVQEI